MTSLTAPAQNDLCLDTRLQRMDTGQDIFMDSPRAYSTDGEVSVLDLTEVEGVPLDEAEENEGDGIYYDEEEDVYWMDVIMDMTHDDERFGFSVMGGVEEGFLPRIDEISIADGSTFPRQVMILRAAVTSGSPADQAQLEVGDEIVEVNGHNLEGYSHAEVIELIHQSIASRSIRLQVRRRPLIEEDAENRVSSDSDIQDAYVVATDTEAHDSLQQLAALYKVSPVDIGDAYDYRSDTAHACDDADTEGIEDAQLSTCSDPITNSPPSVHVNKSEPHVRDASPVLEHNLDTTERNVSEAMETSVVNGFGPASGHVTGSAGMHAPGENAYVNVVENGPHREMAIDCPANFVGSLKEPPRYPPPQSVNSSQSSLRSQHSTPSRGSGAKRHANDLSAGIAMQQPSKATKEDHLEHRIKMYEEDLRKRKEEEQRIAQENEFLRASLRGSKKLQALQESPLANETPSVPPSGIVNPNYVEEDDASSVGVSASKSSTLPLRERDSVEVQDVSVDELLGSLQLIHSRLSSIDDQKQIAQLMPLFQKRAFRHALQTHNKIVAFSLRSPPPAPVAEVTPLNDDVLTSITTSDSPLTRELSQLLQTPHFKGLLTAHDKVVQQKAVPAKTTTAEDESEYILERASQYGEESIKIVRLQKTADPLGATVRNEGESVIVGRIVKGGMAEKSGLLHEGDEIIEINGIDIRGKSVNDVCDLMANLTGTLTFLVVPCNEFTAENNEVDDLSVLHVKAHFDYDPEDDLYIPCRELGISFQKGDILHVINQDDPNWWQAYREGEDDQTLAGLIPSRAFQEQREATKQTVVERKDKKKRHRCKCGVRRGHRKKKKQLYSADGEGDTDEVLTYEEVALYYPQPNRKRPIVLIGPPNVGRQELRQRLMESDPERFAPALPHTSRAPKDGEIDGKDYHFVPRAVFEADIASQKFVEFGEFEKNLYGTSLEAIRQVINIGKICVLNFYPQSLRILKSSDLKPYVVFIAPPRLEKLKQLRQQQGVKVTDDELKDIIEKAREMEENYIQYFDMIVCNYDLDRAYEELLEGINQLDVNPQWVPGTWVT